MRVSLTVLLVLLGGFLLGGVISLWRQRANKIVIGVVAALSLLSFAGALLRVLPA